MDKNNAYDWKYIVMVETLKVPDSYRDEYKKVIAEMFQNRIDALGVGDEIKELAKHISDRLPPCKICVYENKGLCDALERVTEDYYKDTFNIDPCFEGILNFVLVERQIEKDEREKRLIRKAKKIAAKIDQEGRSKILLSVVEKIAHTSNQNDLEKYFDQVIQELN